MGDLVLQLGPAQGRQLPGHRPRHRRQRAPPDRGNCAPEPRRSQRPPYDRDRRGPPLRPAAHPTESRAIRTPSPLEGVWTGDIMNRCSETWWTHYDGMIASHEEI